MSLFDLFLGPCSEAPEFLGRYTRHEPQEAFAEPKHTIQIAATATSGRVSLGRHRIH